MAIPADTSRGTETSSSARLEAGGQGRQPSRHGWVWLAILIVLAIAVVYAYRAHSKSQAASAAAANAGPPAISVGVVTVQKRDVPFYLVGLGSVTAFNTVTVRTRIDGQLMKVYFKEGQFVKEGELLAEIDPRPYQVALEQAQGQLDWLEKMHSAGLYPNELAYPQLKRMAFEFELPLPLTAKVDSAAPRAVAMLKIAPPDAPRPAMSTSPATPPRRR